MYKFLKHTADVLFEAESDSLEKLFEDCAKAVMETMVDLKTVEPKVKKTIKIKSDNLENLLYNFLSELVYLKDSQAMLYSKFEVRKIDIGKFKVIAGIFGEKIDSKKHNLGVDVKGVTMHMFTIEKRKDKWYAKVLLDV